MKIWNIVKKAVVNKMGCLAARWILHNCDDGLVIKRKGGAVQIIKVFAEPAYRNVIKPLMAQPKTGRWIPTSDHLPPDPEGGIPRSREELEDAMVKDKIKEYIVMIDEATKPTVLFYGGEDRWYDCNGQQEYFSVIAWQQLPEPYQPPI